MEIGPLEGGETRSYVGAGRAIIQHGWVLVTGDKRRRHTHREEHHGTREAETGGVQPQRDPPGIASRPTSWARQERSHPGSQKTGPCWLLGSSRLASGSMRVCLCRSKPPSLWYFVTASPGHRYTVPCQPVQGRKGRSDGRDAWTVAARPSLMSM